MVPAAVVVVAAADTASVAVAAVVVVAAAIAAVAVVVAAATGIAAVAAVVIVTVDIAAAAVVAIVVEMTSVAAETKAAGKPLCRFPAPRGVSLFSSLFQTRISSRGACFVFGVLGHVEEFPTDGFGIGEQSPLHHSWLWHRRLGSVQMPSFPLGTAPGSVVASVNESL
jgi:hypothetical protein